MIRRDYILSMIEQLGALFRAIANKETSPDQIDTSIEEISTQWTGLPSLVLFSLPVAEIHRLFEESDRLVGEKSYLMAELFRTKGTLTSDTATRNEFNRKALYFYRKCPDGFEAEIQNSIAEQITILQAATRDVAEPSANHELLRHAVPNPSTKSRQARPSSPLGLFKGIGIAMGAALLYLLFFGSSPSFAVTDTVWEEIDGKLLVAGTLHNRSDSAKRVTIRFLADRASGTDIDNSLSFVGSAEQFFNAPAYSALPYETRLPIASGETHNILVTASIILIEDLLLPPE